MTRKHVVRVVPAIILGLTVAAACAPAQAPSAAKPTAPATQAVAAKAGDPAKGKEMFSQTCSACHGPEGKGMPGLGKDFTTSTFVKGQTDPQLLDFIKKGRPVSDPANTTKVDMPPKGGNPALTDAQLVDIIAFIRTLQR